ncbi:outer membrane beta-barrel protein [Sediminibacterium sp. TEGAF015]|uniref:outer membrane beta-barrel protein n=1 Tax=Sediminibacterium sp. TEGAF015 TaxID=575378 RepID=UPI0021F9565A|nr:carboxypeptidase regulatory-like domain-containing protein [Sediminibacterium sp. TEGAF015]BDQ13301.1 outer membrane protein [Sediminibacterium sp. TEGAF015]
MQQPPAIRLFFTFFFTVLVTTVFSQAKINGKVISATNETLSGTSIKLEGPTSRTVAADVEGRFSISVKPGKYTLTFSRVGYQTKILEGIEAKEGIEANDLNVVLDLKTTTTEVVVRSSARKESSNAMIVFQKTNTAMSSGLAADFIRRTPDRNTSDVLKRVSGASIQDNKFVVVRGLSDRYNQALLNNALMPSSEPDKKAFSFDIIPAAMIDNIIINKTATPDLPGEFAGGLVQVNTRDIPTKNQLNVTVSLGYNSQSTFKSFTGNQRSNTAWLGFDGGGRSLPSSMPNTVTYRGLTDNEKISISKDFNGNAYGEKVNTAAPIRTVNLAWSNTKTFKNEAKLGSIVSVYYRNASIIYDDVERGRFEKVRTPIFTGSEIQNRYSTNLGVMANFTYMKGATKISFRNILNQVYEENYLNRNVENIGRLQNVSLRSNFLNQRLLISSQIEGEHLLSQSRGIKFIWNANGSFNSKSQPDFRTAQYTRNLGATTGAYTLDDDDTRRFFSELKDYSTGLNGTLVVPFNMGGLKQTMKLGGSTLLRFRDFNARVFRYRPVGNNSNLELPFDKMFQTSNINANGLLLEEQTQNTDRYFGISALNSGYLMFDNKLTNSLRVIWGARAEFFEQFLSSRDLALNRVRVNTQKWDFLPSLNITNSFNNQHQIRFAVSQTVARPEFREIAPFQFFDYESIWGIGGETSLRRTKIFNADIRYEYYPKSGEMISVGVFTKKFTDPIELRMDGGSNADRWLFSYTNAASATLVGAEVEIRKGMDFVSDKLKDFTFIGNATVLKSTVKLNSTQASGKETTQNRPLFGQSPYLINAGFQYTNTEKGFNASILYNRQGPRLSLVGDPDGAGFYDIYEKSRNLLDLQVSKKVMNNAGEIKVTVSDVFNNKFAFYDNADNKPGYSYAAGDRINYAYRPGTTVTVSFSYDINFKR